MKKTIKTSTIFIRYLSISIFYANVQQLFVGANYYTHNDKNPERIKNQIALLKSANDFEQIWRRHGYILDFEPLN